MQFFFTCFYTERNNPEKEQKQTRYKNTIHLWEFLLELLEDERYIPLISWTKKEDGEFKIKRQEEVAKRWGRLKQRAGMNYDKLSRALRYYYQKGIIKKVSVGEYSILPPRELRWANCICCVTAWHLRICLRSRNDITFITLITSNTAEFSQHAHWLQYHFNLLHEI